MEFFVLSLQRGDRKHIWERNKKVVPDLKIFKSVNGYNKEETLRELKKSGLKYHNLNFQTWGTLACWLTKVKMLQHQIKYNIPFICFMEDDLILEDQWVQYCFNRRALINHDINIVRLCPWGEGYITSIECAKRLMAIFKKDGIRLNIDNQLASMKEIHIDEMPPAMLGSRTNDGDCLKTDPLPENFAELTDTYSTILDQIMA